MRYNTIIYARTIPTGSYSNEKLGVEIEIEEGETPEQAFASAKELIDKIHRENNPHLYGVQQAGVNNQLVTHHVNAQDIKDVPFTYTEEPIKRTLPLSKEERERERINNTVKQIQEITDGVVLKTFEKLAMAHPETLSAYNIRAMEIEYNNSGQLKQTV